MQSKLISLIAKYVFICLTHISEIISAPKKEGTSTSLGEGGRHYIYEHELHWK